MSSKSVLAMNEDDSMDHMYEYVNQGGIKKTERNER